METIVTAIAGIIFNKFLEKSGENLAGVFATQVGGALAKIAHIHPKTAEALAAGNPQVIDAEIIKEVNQQAEIDPELRSMLAKIAELTQGQFTPEELAKLKASQNAEQAAATIRMTGKKQIDSIQAENIGMVVKEQSEEERIIITTIKTTPSIWDLGKNPVECDVTDGAINHDRFLHEGRQ